MKYLFTSLLCIFSTTHAVAEILCENGSEIFMEFVHYGTNESVDKLLKRCENVHPDLSVQNNTPLIFAIGRENEHRVRSFVNRGADVNHSGEHGRTPLQRAAETGNRQIINFLVDKGADVNAVISSDNVESDEITRTALWYSKNAETLIQLLDRGGDPHIIGSPLLDKAVRQWDAKALVALLNKEIKPDGDSLNFAATTFFQRVDKVALLLNAGANPDSTNLITKETALIDVLKQGPYNIMSNVRSVTTYENYEEAKEKRREDRRVAKLIINAGANPNAIEVDDSHRSALMIAISKGYPSVVELLLNSGADPFKRDNGNNTAFDYAEQMLKSTQAQWVDEKIQEELLSIYNEIIDSLESVIESSTSVSLKNKDSVIVSSSLVPLSSTFMPLTVFQK